MAGHLIGLTAKELLEKFGKGSHKPGSGSAVALQGMLSAQMVKTVIDLTIGKKDYKDKVDKFLTIKTEIEQKIYPELARLLEEDSAQFHKVIVARKERNNASDIEIKSDHESANLRELKVATEMPILVAKHCLRIAECAFDAFDFGFQAVRGDSSVAINGSLSAVSGAISIVNLNLLSFNRDSWTEKILRDADELDIKYNQLLREAEDRKAVLKAEAEESHSFDLEVENLKKNLITERLSFDQIENFTASLQNIIWRYKNIIWKNGIPGSPLEILEPKIILKKLGYQYQQSATLGIHEVETESFEVAGVIDTAKKYVEVSQNFSNETIAFTIAHELGHALLHPNQVLHRERPIDGSNTNSQKDIKEMQADRFAACFLMPRKLVINQFETRFNVKKIHLDNRTAMEFGMKLSDLQMQCRTPRDFARVIANVTQVTYNTFQSLANQFGVSAEAMAIRLEELDLVAN